MTILVFVLFLLIGSFFNVLIHRIPLEESVVFPPSHCPLCKHKLGPMELVPVLSYLFQGGKCRHCGGRISPRYPLVELLTAGALTLVWHVYGGAGEVWPYLVLTSLLIVISFIDLDHLYIPDKLLIVGVLFWLPYFLFTAYIPPAQALVGAGLGFGIMYLIYFLSRGGMGFGDVKFAGLIGLYLGPALLGLTLLIAFISGAVVGVFLLATKLKSRKDAIPFGPYIAIGAYIAMLWGQRIIGWYLRGVGL